MKSHRNRSYVFLIFTAVIWGAAGPIIKHTLANIDPVPFLAYRFLISAVFSLIFFAVTKFPFKEIVKHPVIYFSYAILSVPLSLSALFIGLDRATVLDLTIITLLSPLIISFLAAYFFKEHITKREKIGISVVVFGVLVNSFYPFFTSGALEFSGNIFLIFYLIFNAFGIIIAKHAVRKNIDSSNLSNFAFLIGLFTLVPASIYIYGTSQTINIIKNLNLWSHLGIWYLAVISGTLAYFLYIKAQKSIEVSEAILFSYLKPIFTIPLAVFWLKETISTSFITGAIIITVGVFLAENKRKRIAGKPQG